MGSVGFKVIAGVYGEEEMMIIFSPKDMACLQIPGLHFRCRCWIIFSSNQEYQDYIAADDD